MALAKAFRAGGATALGDGALRHRGASHVVVVGPRRGCNSGDDDDGGRRRLDGNDGAAAMLLLLLVVKALVRGGQPGHPDSLGGRRRQRWGIAAAGARHARREVVV